MKSDLHSKLQNIAENYSINKGYWICGQEVPMPVGICDVWGMSRKDNGESIAIEVKVSRTDFRSRSQIYKETSSFNLGNYQYVLCPQGMIQPNEVHKEWGLLWYNEAKDRIINKKKAPILEMTAQQKLDILLYFLNNGTNVKRPLLKIKMPTQLELLT